MTSLGQRLTVACAAVVSVGTTTLASWAAGMPDMFCSADAPWLDGITPRSVSSHDGILTFFFSPNNLE